MMTKLSIALFAAILLTAPGCGTPVTAGGSAGGGGDGSTAPEAVDPYGDPVEYPADPFEGFPVVFELEYPGAETPAPGDLPSAGGAWAVQIAACSSEDDAGRLGGIASVSTGLPFFVDHEGSWWKVRLGSYRTREEAAEGLEKAVASGFGDAWIVERLP